MRALLALFLVLFLAGCSKNPGTQAAGGRGAPADVRGGKAGCEAATRGVEDGALAGAATADSSDAVATGRFTLDRVGDCRRLGLALVRADGTPAARSGAVHGEFRRAYGLVRLALPNGLARIACADTTFEDDVVRAAYVVHARNGGWYLDVHPAAPALALVRAGDPARLELELAAGGGAIPNPAPSARNVVVIEPRQGAARYPLVIRGYARTFEANVQAWLSVGDQVVPATRTHATAADWATTWGEYELTIPKGPSGDVTLFVGEESAKDGTPIGVTIPLRMP